MVKKVWTACSVTGVTFLILLGLLLALNRWDRPAAPFSGDCGIKLWQASSMAEGRAFLIRPMPVGLPPAAYSPPLTEPSGDSLAGAYSSSFALVTGGLSGGNPLGARVVVLLLTIVSLPLLALLSGGRFRGLIAFTVAGLVPYSLVFWEHGPSVSLFLASVILFLAQVRGATRLPWWIIPLALSCWWRPENATAFAGLAAVSLSSKDRGVGLRRTLFWIAGLAAAVAVVAVTLPELLPANLFRNLPALGPGFLTARFHILWSWIAPQENLPAWIGIGIMTAALGFRAVRRGGRCGSLSAVLLVAGGLPISWYFLRNSMGGMSLFTLAPGLLLLAAAGCGRWDSAGRTMVLGGIIGGVLIFLLSPTDGMFQTGPRFLLAPMALAAAGLLRVSVSSETGRPVPASLRTASLSLLIPVVLLASARAVVFQEFFRSRHMAVAAALSSLPDSLVLATDQPWLPAVAWRTASERPLLYMERDTADSLVESGMPLVWISDAEAMNGSIGPTGYRGLRMSSQLVLPDLPQIPGETDPHPPLLAI